MYTLLWTFRVHRHSLSTLGWNCHSSTGLVVTLYLTGLWKYRPVLEHQSHPGVDKIIQCTWNVHSKVYIFNQLQRKFLSRFIRALMNLTTCWDIGLDLRYMCLKGGLVFEIYMDSCLRIFLFDKPYFCQFLADCECLIYCLFVFCLCLFVCFLFFLFTISG